MTEGIYKLVISILGDYRGWSEVTYKYPKKDGGDKGSFISVRAKSPLKAILEGENPDRIIIFTFDSICVNLDNLPRLNSYDDIVNQVKEDVYRFVQENIVDYKGMDIREIKDRFKVYVLPGKGTFKSRNKPRILIAEGRMADAKYFMYYYLTKEFLNILEIISKSGISRLDVIVDISHGMNYVPAYLLENTLKLLGIIKAVIGNIRLKVLYSDPFIYGLPADKQVLEINSLYGGKASYPIQNYYPADRIEFDKLLAIYNKEVSVEVGGNGDCKPPKEDIKVLSKEIKSFMSEKRCLICKVNIFLKGVSRGLPLIAFHFNRGRDTILKYAEDIISKYYSKIFVAHCKSNGEDAILIYRKLKLDENFHILLSSILYSDFVGKIFESSHRDGWIDINSIIELRDKLYPSKWKDARWILINKEIGKLMNYVKKIQDKLKDGLDPVPMHKFLVKYLDRFDLKWLFKGEDEGDWIRNLYAHAGFHYGMFKIRIPKPGKIELSYRLRERIFKYNNKIYFDINSVLDENEKNEVVAKGEKVSLEELIKKSLGGR